MVPIVVVRLPGGREGRWLWTNMDHGTIARFEIAWHQKLMALILQRLTEPDD